MLDESKQGPRSHGVKLGRQGLQGRRQLKSRTPGANGSNHQSDTSSKDNSVSKSKRASLPAAPQKGSNASDDTFVVKVDGSTIRVTINGDSRIFGSDNVDLNSALAGQVLDVIRRRPQGRLAEL